MIFNPVAARELRSALRSRRTLILGGVALAVMAALVAWLWPERGVFSLQAQASRSLVVSFAVALTGIVLLYAPAFSSAALVWEKENRSWELLLASRLTAWTIVTGKLLASTGVLLLLVLLSFPFLASAFVLGALSLAEAMRLYTVVVVTALFSGVAGLAISASARSAHSALVRAFAGMAAWAGLPWFVHALLRDIPHFARAAALIRSVSPVAAAVSVLHGGADASGVAGDWRRFLLFTGGAGLFLFLGLVVALYRRPSSPRFGTGRVIDDAGELQRRRRRFPFYLVDPQRRKRGVSDHINPIFAREFHGRALGGGVWIFRAMVACFAVSAAVVILLAGQVGGQSPDGIKAFALAFQIGLILLVAPALTCGAVTQEREGRQLDLLRLSRTGPCALLAGKVQVALLFILLLLVSCIPLWLVIVVMELNTPAELMRSWAVILAALALSLVSGLAASSVARRTAVAAGLAYAVLLVVAVFTLFPQLAPDRFAPEVREAWSAANPFLAAYGVLRSEDAGPVLAVWARHLRFTLSLAFILGVLAYVRTWWIYRPDR